MFCWRRIYFGLIILSMLVFADSSMLVIRDKLDNYVEQLNDFRMEILQQIAERNERNFAEEGFGLSDRADRWISNSVFLIDLIDIHQTGQRIHPKKLYLVDKRIQDSKNGISDYLAIDLEHIDNILSAMESPYLVTRGVELKNTMKAVKKLIDSLDFLSIYK